MSHPARRFLTALAMSALLIPAAQRSAVAQVPEGAQPPGSLASRVIPPLREIGRVTARTHFCKTFLEDSGAAVDSAIAFEAVLLDTVGSFNKANFNSELHKHLTLETVRSKVALLGKLAITGREELAKLDTLAMESDDDRHDEVIGFRDALAGAKSRQLLLARKLSRLYGTLAEVPISTNATLPHDLGGTTTTNPFNRGVAAYGNSNLLDTLTDQAQQMAAHGLFQAMPGDEFIGDDLARAADHGKAVLSLGNCR